jgi:hypothetical protein
MRRCALLPAEREVSLSVPASDGVIPMALIGCVQLHASQPLEPASKAGERLSTYYRATLCAA